MPSATQWLGDERKEPWWLRVKSSRVQCPFTSFSFSIRYFYFNSPCSCLSIVPSLYGIWCVINKEEAAIITAGQLAVAALAQPLEVWGSWERHLISWHPFLRGQKQSDGFITHTVGARALQSGSSAPIPHLPPAFYVTLVLDLLLFIEILYFQIFWKTGLPDTCPWYKILRLHRKINKKWSSFLDPLSSFNR